MYAKCGELEEGKELLNMHMSNNSAVTRIVTWMALIVGYVEERRGQYALDCLEQLQREGILLETVTYECILETMCHDRSN